ncbi:MAG: hypothetical protein V8R82_10200 [Clostridia bacterium]
MNLIEEEFQNKEEKEKKNNNNYISGNYFCIYSNNCYSWIFNVLTKFNIKSFIRWKRKFKK